LPRPCSGASKAPALSNLTTQAAGALAHAAQALPPELAPTIFQLPILLSDERWRDAVLPFLPKASEGFWLDRFPLLSEEAITPLTNLVDRLRGSTPMTALLGQSQSSYRVREAMDQGWIVLAHPGSGGTRERLLANLLLFDLLHAAKGRSNVESDARKPFWIFLDEVQTYDSVASGNLAALLEQSAKFGLRAVVLNQNPERLNPQTLNALTTNRSHLLTSALNSHAAALLTKEWGRRVSPDAVTQLGRYRFIAQVTDRGKLSKPFALEGIRVKDVPELPGDRCGERSEGAVTLVEASEVIEHLETLDERILTTLSKSRKSTDAKAPEPAEGAPADRSAKPPRSLSIASSRRLRSAPSTCPAVASAGRNGYSCGSATPGLPATSARAGPTVASGTSPSWGRASHGRPAPLTASRA
jgi:hypothetical protein